MRTKKQEVARFTYLKPKQVADEMNLDEDVVREHIRAGNFPDVDGEPGVVDVSTGKKLPQYRIHPKAFEAFKATRNPNRKSA